jgi:hypothetical protein
MSQLLGECSGLSLLPPHGLQQIVAAFGDIFAYLRPDHRLDPKWQADVLVSVQLPFPTSLSWNRSHIVERITCHKLLAETLGSVFLRIQTVQDWPTP